MLFLSVSISKQAGHSLQVGHRTDCVRGPSGTGKGTVNRYKRHRCPYCPYISSFTTNLLNHIRTHTGEKPYSCPYCPLRFAQKGSVRSHILTHTGEKPFACSHCDYRSSRKTTLKAHIVSHHLHHS